MCTAAVVRGGGGRDDSDCADSDGCDSYEAHTDGVDSYRGDSDRGTRTAVVVAVARSQRERVSDDSVRERNDSDRSDSDDRGSWWRRVGFDADTLIAIKYISPRPPPPRTTAAVHIFFIRKFKVVQTCHILKYFENMHTQICE